MYGSSVFEIAAKTYAEVVKSSHFVVKCNYIRKCLCRVKVPSVTPVYYRNR